MPRCHYDVLGVERDADDDVLKKAYRRLALTWHPDKNLDQLELATENFKELQASYAVLSDKHERAWYDDHRESILRGASSGGGGRAGGGGGDDDLDGEGFDLWAFFSASCYSGFGDDERSFYSVYGLIFDRIDRAERDSLPKGRAAAPELGGDYSSWADVRSFYAHWESFATAKPMASVDLYDTRAAANRQVRRAMDKENDKARSAARRKANECVRNLASYMKKRDRRWTDHMAAVERERAVAADQAAAERKARQAEHDARRAEERRERTAAWDASAEGAEIDQLLANYSDGEEGARKKKGKKGKRAKGGAETDAAGGAGRAALNLSAAAAAEEEEEGGSADGDGAAEAAVTAAAQAELAALEEADSLYCAACNKHFKNFKQCSPSQPVLPRAPVPTRAPSPWP